jgi:hypothetical protein
LGALDVGSKFAISYILCSTTVILRFDTKAMAGDGRRGIAQ